MVAADLSFAAGCIVIKALPLNRCIDVHPSGDTLRRRVLPRYWTVVQHRARICTVSIDRRRVREGCSAAKRFALRVDVASLILLTEYDPPWYHRPNVKQSSRG